MKLKTLFAISAFLVACGVSILAAEPAVFSAPPGALTKLKAKLAAKDTSVQPAFDALLRDADRALRATPDSVTHKPKPPASGDPHDYSSTAPYFWPDPTKPDGLPYLRKDGQRNPESGNEHSDSLRLGRTARNAETLALAYSLTGKEDYAAHAAQLLRVFFLDPATRMNPNLNHAQAIPGINSGRGIGMIESRSLTSVADASALLEKSSHWSAAERKALTDWLGAFLDWALTSKNGKEERAAKNNHGVWYDVQVVHLALATGKTNLAREIIEAAKETRIAAQIKPDGSQPLELARADGFHYTRFNLQAFVRLAVLGQHIGVDLWRFESNEGAGLRKAFDFLLPFIGSSARPWPHNGPARSDAAITVLFRQAHAVYGEARYAEILKQLPDAQAQREVLFY